MPRATGDFNAVPSRHPAIEVSQLEQDGEIRRVAVAGGGETVEREIARDEGSRSYSYELVEGPMPVSEYRATLEVDDGPRGGALVRWSSDFTPAGASEADAKAAISDFLRAGLANLHTPY